jgi:hypothetical protein
MSPGNLSSMKSLACFLMEGWSAKEPPAPAPLVVPPLKPVLSSVVVI